MIRLGFFFPPLRLKGIGLCLQKCVEHLLGPSLYTGIVPRALCTQSEFHVVERMNEWMKVNGFLTLFLSLCGLSLFLIFFFNELFLFLICVWQRIIVLGWTSSSEKLLQGAPGWRRHFSKPLPTPSWGHKAIQWHWWPQRWRACRA